MSSNSFDIYVTDNPILLKAAEHLDFTVFQDGITAGIVRAREVTTRIAKTSPSDNLREDLVEFDSVYDDLLTANLESNDWYGVVMWLSARDTVRAAVREFDVYTRVLRGVTGVTGS